MDKTDLSDLSHFCNRITPVNWHVTTRADQFGFWGPGTLNVFIKVLDRFIDGWFYAFKSGTMQFNPVSLYSHLGTRAAESLRRYGDYLVGESEIWFYPQGCQFFGDDLYASAVHELAHVAVDRWSTMKRKSHEANRRPEKHGEFFCRAFETLIRRVRRFGGHDRRYILAPLKAELQNYRRGVSLQTHGTG